MDSDFQQQQYQHHFQDFPRQLQHQKQQQTSSLTRFRSAPSSYFASFLDVAADTVAATGGAGGGGGGGERGDFAYARPLSPETENIFARFMSNIGAEINSSSQKPSNLPVNSSVQPEFTVRVKQETDIQQHQTQEQQQQLQLQQQHMQQQQQQQQIQQGNYSDQSQMIYHSQSKAPMSNQHSSAVSAAMQNSFRAAAASSTGRPPITQMKTDIGRRNINNSSSLTRHSSSPAGFFDNLNIDAGYGITRGMGNYGGGIGANVQVNISQGQSTTSELMNQNSDAGAKRLRMDSIDERRFSNSSNNQNNDSNYEFSTNSWEESILSENFSGLDRVEEEDRKIFPELNASGNQSGEGKNHPPTLTHHLSLSKTRPELSNMEKFLQYQDTVPLRIRAKRGCATHPRSIAERVRRTRISERMRKLQDLVPNMDKQTNTADMLDLAVDYIKDLQKQVENLADNRAKCTCSE